MKNITEHLKGLFEVRIKRRGKNFNKYFKKSELGSRKEALDAAIKYRDKILSEYGEFVDRELKGGRKNQTTGINGVSSQAKENNHGNTYLIFNSHYRDENRKARSKAFSAGNIEKLSKETEIRIFKIALLFRLDYEFHRQKEIPFTRGKNEYSQYKHWTPEELERRFSELGVSESEVSLHVKKYLGFKQS